MNTTIKTMSEHVSVRAYKDTPLTAEQREGLLIAAQSGATSHYVQAFSMIEITDENLRAQLGEISNCPSYVKGCASFYVFVADFFRHSQLLENAGESFDGIVNMEALSVAIVDATISAQNVAVAAESMDLGICYIGGIRNDVNRVAELLNLPRFTYPLFGLCIGVPEKRNERKPRLPLKNQVFANGYQTEQAVDLSEFEETVETYYANRGSNQKQSTWSQQMIDYLKKENRPDIAEFLRKQGFTLD